MILWKVNNYMYENIKKTEFSNISENNDDSLNSFFLKYPDFSFIHNMLPCGIFRCKNDKDLTLTYMNDGFLRLTEYTREELIRLYNNSFASIIYSEDLQNVVTESMNIKPSSIDIDMEFRIITKSGKLVWVLSKGMICQCSSNEYEYCSALVDITYQKKAMRLLTKKAEHDGLTNLYNRVTTQILIDNYLKYEVDNSKAVFFILDIDNFKTINDTYGHPYADTILVDIAKSLRSLYRSTDILCRAGGDEMIVFLKDIQSKDIAMDKANDLIKSIAEISKRRSTGLPITCSIGVSLYPNDGKTFDDLYKKADTALYYAKEEGKGQIFFYDALPKTYHYLNAETKHTHIDSKNMEPETEGDWLLWYSFNLLNDSDDIPGAINLILSLLGQKTGVDRVYIFEYAENHTRFRNTFEWCNEGIDSEMENLQALTIDSVKAIFDKFDETNGLLYCKDIEEFYPDPIYYVLKPQNITSVLQCELKNGGQRFGMLGFDECHGKKYWSLKLVDLLIKFSHLISVYLSNYRLKQYIQMEGNSRFPSL